MADIFSAISRARCDSSPVQELPRFVASLHALVYAMRDNKIYFTLEVQPEGRYSLQYSSLQWLIYVTFTCITFSG